MKKKKDWITKAKKRKVKKKDGGIVDLVRIVHHFFRKLPQWIDEMKDPRNPSYITYTQSDLVFMGILKNICAVKTMRSMEEKFNEERMTVRLTRQNGCWSGWGKNTRDCPSACRGDALYAAEPIMKICNGKGWKYILTQKETRQKILADTYGWIQEGGGRRASGG